MKLLILLIMLTAAFLGGYYYGQQPDSPNLEQCVQQGCQEVDAVSQKVAEVVGKDKPAPTEKVATAAESNAGGLK